MGKREVREGKLKVKNLKFSRTKAKLNFYLIRMTTSLNFTLAKILNISVAKLFLNTS